MQSGERMRAFLLLLCLATVAIVPGCRPPTPHAEASQRLKSAHDLRIDEEHGGHTLQRHVARTDDDLRARLQREPNISAASTYTDRATAERVIAAALQQKSEEIQHWVARGPRRPNLVIDYTDPHDPIGRTMHRGAMGSVPCDHAIVVLRADQDSYYVLTSYPECRS
ncbi:MAG: RNase A-like domain-containing protein [Terriglobales bacterium]